MLVRLGCPRLNLQLRRAVIAGVFADLQVFAVVLRIFVPLVPAGVLHVSPFFAKQVALALLAAQYLSRSCCASPSLFCWASRSCSSCSASLSCSPWVSLSCSPWVSLSCSPWVSLSCSPWVSLSCSPWVVLVQVSHALECHTHAPPLSTTARLAQLTKRRHIAHSLNSSSKTLLSVG
jgi:hypothetical protein